MDKSVITPTIQDIRKNNSTKGGSFLNEVQTHRKIPCKDVLPSSNYFLTFLERKFKLLQNYLVPLIDKSIRPIPFLRCVNAVETIFEG
mmetsp:Transcript_5178/g.7588  ORF Transcript_5178/g.7588 Transcript_5178/m.7588 type:complete len:88 (-) Transcript_5178:1085-1348(-)